MFLPKTWELPHEKKNEIMDLRLLDCLQILVTPIPGHGTDNECNVGIESLSLKN
jgi:hypothetical protein